MSVSGVIFGTNTEQPEVRLVIIQYRNSTTKVSTVLNTRSQILTAVLTSQGVTTCRLMKPCSPRSTLPRTALFGVTTSTNFSDEDSRNVARTRINVAFADMVFTDKTRGYFSYFLREKRSVLRCFHYTLRFSET
jgi:hypothetical protein